MKISIVTATYNRRRFLPLLFNSLVSQQHQDMEWIVVDDGGNDGSGELIEEFRKRSLFPIKYIHQSNGGKHRAMNTGIAAASGELLAIVDDDDRFLPSTFAEIVRDFTEIASNDHICGISYLCVDDHNNISGRPFPRDRFLSNHIECRINLQACGDKVEVFKTEILRRFRFPVIEGESFISETVLWAEIAAQYDTLYVNRPVLVKRYLEQGISQNWRKTVLQNPMGMELYYKVYLNRNVRLRIRARYTVAYIALLTYLGKDIREIFRRSSSPLLLSCICLLPGVICGIKWKRAAV